MDPIPSPRRLAVLIDADNASPSTTEGLFAEVANYGVAIVKRIYGDWTTPNLKTWKERLLEHSIQPIQQFRYTVGKSSTDSAMIIDAMDLLYRAKLDGFCLVSSDSDFTRLASRIREEGLMVIGFGERKTPRAFVTACDRFVFVDILARPKEEEEEDGGGRVPRRSTKELQQDKALVNLLQSSVDAIADEDGWANLGGVGAKIVSQQPDFDPRNYGYPKLMQLFEAIKLFDIDKAPHGEHGQIAVFVANREARR
ncbi:MAG: NYN domain-containing protein [Planctomycetes bacterium]|nr:NYN domain-containing protein [Planctomycetota bacterium]